MRALYPGYNARLYYMGRRRAGMAQTPAQALVIRAHIRKRAAEFRASLKESHVPQP